MIKFFLNAIANPQGAIAKAVLHLIKGSKYGKYVDKENELDVAVKDMQKEFQSMKFKINAQRDLFKDIQEQIESVKKIAHPPLLI